MSDISSKSLVAKLLATENITIEMRNVPTALSDLKNRILILPNLKETLSKDVYDLFVGHEVSHFLWTPQDEWAESLKHTKKSILNIVEDCRVEKKIQQKYPGLKNIFVRAYNDLFEKDFFGIEGKDLNTMSFLNRINLHTKVGASLCIDFSFEEHLLLEKVNSTETYQDVVKVSMEIEQFLEEQKEKNEEEKQEKKNKNAPEEETDSDYEFGDEDEEETDDEDSDEETDHEDSDGDEDEFSNDEEEDEFSTSTADAFEYNSESLLSDDYKEKVYIDLTVPDSSEYIISATELIKKTFEYYTSMGYTREKNKYPNYSKFIKDNSKIVQFLVNEFTLKQNADEYQRIKTSKTGLLNEKKLFAHLYSEDIFRVSTKVQKGKSHGIVMFLDWSGSMFPYIQDTIKQILNVVLFCQKLNIPFEVYAFSSAYNKGLYSDTITKPGIVVDKKICSLLNIFSSKMQKTEFKEMADFLLAYNGKYLTNYFSHGVQLPGFFDLHRTPIDETIILAMDIIPKFKKETNSQFVHTMFLTDGEASDNIRYAFNYENTYSKETSLKLGKLNTDSFPRNVKQIIRNTKTKLSTPLIDGKMRFNRYYIDYGTTQTLFTMLNEHIDDNVIGFRITNQKDVTKGRLNYYFNENREESISKFKKQKYIGIKTPFYDKCFIVKDSGLTLDEDADYEVKENASVKRIAAEFTKFSKGKVMNRLFLKEFIEMLV